MKQFWNTIQLIFSAVGGWLGYFLGGCDGLETVLEHDSTHLFRCGRLAGVFPWRL